MIYKVDKYILDTILDKLPFLRYNDTSFLYREEQLYGDIILRRIEGKLDIKEDFERNKEAFKQICKGFLDPNLAKTFENTQNYLFVGNTVNDLKVTQVPNWNAINELFQKLKLPCKLSYFRYIISIPCGTLNLNITKLNKDDNFYLEVLDFARNGEFNKIKDLLNLNTSLDKGWIDIVKEKNLNVSIR